LALHTPDVASDPSDSLYCNGSVHSGAAEVLPYVEADLKKTALRVIDKAKALCAQVPVHRFMQIMLVMIILSTN